MKSKYKEAIRAAEGFECDRAATLASLGGPVAALPLAVEMLRRARARGDEDKALKQVISLASEVKAIAMRVGVIDRAVKISEDEAARAAQNVARGLAADLAESEKEGAKG